MCVVGRHSCYAHSSRHQHKWYVSSLSSKVLSFGFLPIHCMSPLKQFLGLARGLKDRNCCLFIPTLAGLREQVTSQCLVHTQATPESLRTLYSSTHPQTCTQARRIPLSVEVTSDVSITRVAYLQVFSPSGLLHWSILMLLLKYAGKSVLERDVSVFWLRSTFLIFSKCLRLQDLPVQLIVPSEQIWSTFIFLISVGFHNLFPPSSHKYENNQRIQEHFWLHPNASSQQIGGSRLWVANWKVIF